MTASYKIDLNSCKPKRTWKNKLN